MGLNILTKMRYHRIPDETIRRLPIYLRALHLQIADRLVRAGIKGILNFSPIRIQVPGRVKVFTIDIAMDLARLPYYMT